MLDTLRQLSRRVRQHHAIEHATIHLLSERFNHRRFSGYSDPFGFTLHGAVTEPALRRAVSDALLRLQAGESELARHPNCGTNLVTTATLVTLAALLPGRRRNSLERFAMSLVLVMPALLLGGRLGMRLQGYTTLAEVNDRWLVDLYPVQLGNLQLYRVVFE